MGQRFHQKSIHMSWSLCIVIRRRCIPYRCDRNRSRCRSGHLHKDHLYPVVRLDKPKRRPEVRANLLLDCILPGGNPPGRQYTEQCNLSCMGSIHLRCMYNSWPLCTVIRHRCIRYKSDRNRSRCRSGHLHKDHLKVVRLDKPKRRQAIRASSLLDCILPGGNPPGQHRTEQTTWRGMGPIHRRRMYNLWLMSTVIRPRSIRYRCDRNRSRCRSGHLHKDHLYSVVRLDKPKRHRHRYRPRRREWEEDS